MPSNTPSDDDSDDESRDEAHPPQTGPRDDVDLTDEQLGRLVVLFWLGILTFPLSLLALFLYFLVRDMLGQ